MSVIDALALREAAGNGAGGVRAEASGTPPLPFRWARLLWIAPLVASLTVTTVYPGLFLLALAVSDSRLGKPFRAFSGLKNLAASASDPLFLSALVRSAVYAVASSLVQLALGLAIALLLSALVKSGRFLMSFILLPLMTPPVMVGIAWKLILAPAGGLLNGVLMAIGLTDQPISFLGTDVLAWASVGVADVWQWTPFIAILCFAAIASLPGDVWEAAALDGATRWQTFRRITLPLLAPQLAAIFLLRLVIAFKIFDLIYVLTFGGPGFATTTATFAIWRRALEQFDVGRAAAETLIFSLVVGVVTLPAVWFAKRTARAAGEGGETGVSHA
jgi:multiple sugar transport system permease protein